MGGTNTLATAKAVGRIAAYHSKLVSKSFTWRRMLGEEGGD